MDERSSIHQSETGGRLRHHASRGGFYFGLAAIRAAAFNRAAWAF
jgi:hypothetical protein